MRAHLHTTLCKPAGVAVCLQLYNPAIGLVAAKQHDDLGLLAVAYLAANTKACHIH